MLLFGPPRSGKSQLLRKAAAAAGAAVFSLEPSLVEASAPRFEELYGRKDNATGTSKSGSYLSSPSCSSCALVVAAAFAAARACSCPSIVHLPCAEALFVSDAGGGGRGAKLGGCLLPPAASILPALLREASVLRARERVAVVGESSRPHEAAGRRDSSAMGRFFAGGFLPVGPPSGSEERRAVVVAVAEASGARLAGGATTKKAAAAAAGARPEPKQQPSAAADLDALCLTADGWAAGDLARAVRGALEARRRRRREGEQGGGGGSRSGEGGSGEEGAEVEKASCSSSSSSSSPRPPPPPLCGPLTAREIFASLIRGPRPPNSSELAAALDWARAATGAAVVDSGEEDDGRAKSGGDDKSMAKRASSAASAAKRGNA